jgi:hypothetical protein
LTFFNVVGGFSSCPINYFAELSDAGELGLKTACHLHNFVSQLLPHRHKRLASLNSDAAYMLVKSFDFTPVGACGRWRLVTCNLQ